MATKYFFKKQIKEFQFHYGSIEAKSKVTSMEVTPEMIKGIVAFPKRIRIANE